MATGGALAPGCPILMRDDGWEHGTMSCAGSTVGRGLQPTTPTSQVGGGLAKTADPGRSAMIACGGAS